MEREEVRQRFQRIKERAFRKVDEEWQRALTVRPKDKEPVEPAAPPPAVSKPRPPKRRARHGRR